MVGLGNRLKDDVQILLTRKFCSPVSPGWTSPYEARGLLANKEGEEDGSLGSHEMGVFPLPLESPQKTAGCPREYLGRVNGKQAEGKERHQ